MKARHAAAVAGLVAVLGVVGAMIAQANIAARDALYARPAASAPDEIYGGVAYSVQPWPTVLTARVIVAVVGAVALLTLSVALVLSLRRARLGV